MEKAKTRVKAAGNAGAEKDIDAYLASLPEEVRPLLEKLRKTIRAAAPKALGKISYGMPVYFQDGMLVAFAAFKGHCSFFPMSVDTLRKFKKELGEHDTLKGTVHFTAARPLPAALVRRIVKARVAENGERARIRNTKKK